MKTKVVDRLNAVLKDGIDVHRCAAARALAAFESPAVTDALVGALMDEDPDVRVDAALALSNFNNPDTANKLMESLVGDPDSDVKKAAVATLIALKHTPVLPLLRALTTSRSEELVAWDEGEFYADGWDNWDDIQLSAIRGLGAFGDEEGVTPILDAMADEMGQDVSEPAFAALAKMGAAGARAMATMFEIDDARLRRRIARAVGKSDNTHLEKLRGEMLSAASPIVRAIAVETLSPADPRLADMFGDEDTNVRAAMVRHHGAANAERLGDMIADDASEVRIEVFKHIAANPAPFQSKELIEAVKNTLKGDPKAAKQAALALFALKGPKVAKGFTHVLTKQDVPREFRIGVLETLEKAGDIATPSLLEVAGDPDRHLRLASLTVLANIATNEPKWPNDAGVGLLAALRGELVLPPEELEEVDEIVAEPTPKPDQAELDDIAAEIEETAPLVAADAAPGSTLRAIMSNEPDLSHKEPEEIVLDETQERLLAMTNTRKLGKRKVSWQTEVAPHQDVQRFSARLLGQVVQPDVTEALITALSGEIDGETREAAMFSLAEHGAAIGTLPVELFEVADSLLSHEVSDIRVLATRILGYIGKDGITEKLAGLVTHSDPLVRVEAIHGLDKRNVAGPEVLAALNDNYLGTSIAAARALARLGGDEAVDALVAFAQENDGTHRREIGRLFGEFAPEKGAAALLDLLNDEDRKAQWLVAIDALAELFQLPEPDQTLLVA